MTLPCKVSAQRPYPLIDTESQYRQLLKDFAQPGELIGFDVERADWANYHRRAYLVQARSDTGLKALLDPLALNDLSAWNEVCQGSTWVIHAASNDLESLAQVGLVPPKLFDTQIAAKLLGYPQVGLGPLLQRIFGIDLAKDHSRENWYQRPLPSSWLQYAALDVEYLPVLARHLHLELQKRGRTKWAQAEFDYVRTHFHAFCWDEPWRKVKGASRLRNRKQLAVLKQLYATREKLAQKLDRSPAHLLSDLDMIDLALHIPRSLVDYSKRPFLENRLPKRYRYNWWNEIKKVNSWPRRYYPPLSQAGKRSALPAGSDHQITDVKRLDYLETIQVVIGRYAEENQIWGEMLLSAPERRQLSSKWHPGADVAKILSQTQARKWQIQLLAPLLSPALEAL